MVSKPNVLVAGFSRCATTYLYNVLKQHPDIYIPEEKEINCLHKYPVLLSHPHLVNPKFFLPRSWYYRKFNFKKPVKIDFSMMTSYDLGSAERIRRELGDIRIIFITRDKEEHKKSVIKTIINHGEKVPFDVEKFSNFEIYMKPYKKQFSHVLHITKEELEKNPKKTLAKTTRFLDIDNFGFNFDVYKNPSGSYFEDKHGSKQAYRTFRLRRNALKAVSYVLSLIVGKLCRK